VKTFVQNEGDLWTYTRSEIGRYYERVLTSPGNSPRQEAVVVPYIGGDEPPRKVRELVGSYIDLASLLGRRTAELHVALASDAATPAFAPEPYTALDQRSAYQSMRNLTGKVLRTLRSSMATLPQAALRDADALLTQEAKLYKRFEALLAHKLTAMRTRCHGNLHLGQVLYTGKDVVVFDYDGDRSRLLADRRRKRSPLFDIAVMLRSFHYVALVAMLDNTIVREVDRATVEPWAEVWHATAGASFVRAYLQTVDHAPFMPRNEGEITILIDAFLFERALTELRTELDAGGARAVIPLRALIQMLGR
jgi:maltose alpha-D-glucosyltransferase/alpha-amylase